MNKEQNIPQGYKDSPLGVIPQEWKVRRLGKVCSIKGGYAFDSKSFKTSGKYQIIKMSNLHEGELNISRSQSFLEELPKNATEYLLEKDDILITLTGTVGKQDYGYSYQIKNESDLLVNQRVGKITSNGIHPQYLYLILKTTRFLVQFFYSSRGGTGNQSNVSTNDISNITILFPPLEEQKRIAKVLGVWDEAIERQAKMVALLETRKRALMQRLLTSKPHWQKTKLGEIGYTYNGLTGKTKDDFEIGDSNYVTYVNIFNNWSVNTSIFGKVDVKESENQNRVKQGDIFFTVSSETPEEVGMSSVLLDNINDTYLNSFCFGYRLFNFEKLLPKFAKYYFRGKKFRTEMYMLAQGSTRFNISKSEVLKLQVKLPSIAEQKAIAEKLSTADTEIDLAKRLLQLLRTQKRALMQQLLTGKKRIKYD